MPWHRFVFTRRFWAARETPLYMSMLLFIIATVLVSIALALGAPEWVIALWVMPLVIFMCAWASIAFS